MSLFISTLRAGTLALLFSVTTIAGGADDLSDVQRLYYAGQSEAAMRRADQYLVAHPKDPQMRFMKSVMLADAKRSGEAAALLHAISEDYPDLAEPYNNLAVLYADAGEYDKARGALDQALRNNPSYATAHENLGDVYAALAAQSYGRALKLEPSNVTVPPKLALIRQLYKRGGGASAKAAAAIASAASAP
jgi:tetratricopeptide (TPR) repeat protein